MARRRVEPMAQRDPAALARVRVHVARADRRAIDRQERRRFLRLDAPLQVFRRRVPAVARRSTIGTVHVVGIRRREAWIVDNGGGGVGVHEDGAYLAPLRGAGSGRRRRAANVREGARVGPLHRREVRGTRGHGRGADGLIQINRHRHDAVLRQGAAKKDADRDYAAGRKLGRRGLGSCYRRHRLGRRLEKRALRLGRAAPVADACGVREQIANRDLALGRHDRDRGAGHGTRGRWHHHGGWQRPRYLTGRRCTWL